MASRENMPEQIGGLSAIAGGYRGLYCDIWGVVHDGVTAYSQAIDVLRAFRQRHGPVVLITNAPRPCQEVRRSLHRLKVPEDAYDAIVSSGDVTRNLLIQRSGQKVYHLGPDRDLPVLENIELERVSLERADFILCTGLFRDDTETPEDYRDLLATARARSLEMICANPDRVVEVGDRLHYCAGSLADAYAQIGGPVINAGKPHPPIYDLALALLEAAAGRRVARHEILAIGDSIRTDLAGAAAMGMDALFVTGGIHDGKEGAPGLQHESVRIDRSAQALARQCAEAGVRPRAMLRRLAW